MVDDRRSPFDDLRTMEEGRKQAAIARLPEDQLARIAAAAHLRAHRGQVPPGGDWTTWLILAGRGFGKTFAGAAWVDARARAMSGARIALVRGDAGRRPRGDGRRRCGRPRAGARSGRVRAVAAAADVDQRVAGDAVRRGRARCAARAVVPLRVGRRDREMGRGRGGAGQPRPRAAPRRAAAAGADDDAAPAPLAARAPRPPRPESL